MSAKEKGKGLIAEFKTFALRGNVVDLAIGVIIGGAFATITNSLINDLVMPIVGVFLGGVDFATWSIALPNLYGGESIPLNIGSFIQTVVNFLILALVVFLMVKVINRLTAKKKKEEPAAPSAPPAPTGEELLLTEIRDLLKEQRHG